MSLILLQLLTLLEWKEISLLLDFREVAVAGEGNKKERKREWERERACACVCLRVCAGVCVHVPVRLRRPLILIWVRLDMIHFQFFWYFSFSNVKSDFWQKSASNKPLTRGKRFCDVVAHRCHDGVQAVLFEHSFALLWSHPQWFIKGKNLFLLVIISIEALYAILDSSIISIKLTF